ncbi:MAG: M20/M25/M40 family metallo-hydrolase [Minisyncoccia bacterium]
MISDLKKLIKFKTITGNFEENDKALKWVKSKIDSKKYFIKEFKSEGYTSLVITAQRTIKPRIFLVAHMDVAKAENEMFVPKVKNNNLHARGAFDMKYAIACYLGILKELKNDSSKYDFGVMITTDEEYGGKNGVKFLLDRGFDCDVAFLPDGSENWKIEKASKGVWCFVIKSHGRSAHPSMPWKGENALETLMDYLCKLQKGFKNEPCGDPLHIHSTMDVNEFNTGRTGDNLPDYAEAMVDIFFTSENEFKKIIKTEKELRKKYPGLKLNTTILNPSVRMDTDNKYADEFYLMARKLYGIKKETMFTHGTSDAHYFIEKGISVIETRPNGGDFHGDGEWIDLRDMERFYRVLKKFVERIAIIQNLSG